MQEIRDNGGSREDMHGVLTNEQFDQVAKRYPTP